MEIEVLGCHNSKPIATLENLSSSTTVKDLKKQLYAKKKNLYPERQSFRLEAKGKSLNDNDTIGSLKLKGGAKIYLKDLGPQIGWKTVFLVEYAAGCWTLHYAKRLLETLFVHRFSHATMPLRNLFKNSSYYWLFTAYVAYHVNHPLFTPPCELQMYVGLAFFLLCEFGNLSIHLALRNLRPAGTTVRKIPMPTGNPFTGLFNLVSCPNYTYEFGSWAAFTALTQCLPAGIFALAGLYQMTVWAIGKHKIYKKEFPAYPKRRKSILPFII
ncbi:hypothetical protein B566_EDAN007364 [Ephemera danica]|nr:hypothetical protein B566_EDAN007364 [Ephemera danica]